MIRLSKSVVGEAEKKAVCDALTAGFLGMGPRVKEFEDSLSAYLGDHVSVACVNSGTAALHLAVEALGIGPGDEVLVPSLTFVACFQAIAATGARPVACDVDAETVLLDLGDAARRVTARTKAVLYVHYASEPGDPERVYEFAERHRLRVIEDAAHSFGCSHKGKRIGAVGDVTCFSFDGIKNITSGEGGAVVSRDTAVLSRVRDLRLLGVEKDSDNRYAGKRSWEFDVSGPGWRYHMSDVMAAIGIAQLRRLEGEFAPARRKLAAEYRRRLGDLPGLRLLPTQGEGIVPHIFPVRVLDGKRDELRALLETGGVQTGIHYKPNHLLSRFRRNGISLPNSERLYEELLTLPIHPELGAGDQSRVIDAVVRWTAGVSA